jgi:hypothetical protein
MALSVSRSKKRTLDAEGALFMKFEVLCSNYIKVTDEG